MKYAVEMATVATIYECITSFINIELSIQKLTRETFRHTEGQSRKPTFISSK
jgi:hypothetical protein